MKAIVSIDHGNRLTKPYSIQITGAHAFPQAYAAAVTVFDKLKDSNLVNIVDVGGFTVDCLQLNKFKPNMTLCTSLYLGVNTLFDNINEGIRSEGGINIPTGIIEGILKKDPAEIAEIAQKGFDFVENRTVFMGGGSILLKDYILQTGKVKKPMFIDDVHANAKGYRLLYDVQTGNAGKQSQVA